MNVRKSIWVTLLASNVGMVIGFASSLIVARLLSPADIGAFSIAVVLVNLVSVFRDLGINAYLIQKKNLSPDDLGAALGLTLFTGAVLGAALWWASGPFARAYGQPAIEQVLHVLIVSFLLVPYANVAGASLMRELRATRSAAIGICGALLHMGVVVGAALGGAAHLAPAYANLANIVLTVLLSAAFAPEARHLIPSWRGWRPLLHFGVGATAESLLGAAYSALPDLVLGKTSGTHDVGLFSRAAGLVGLLLQAIYPAIQYTAGPVLARSHHEEQALGPLLAQGASLVTAVAWPTLGLMALLAEPLIRLLYGTAWVPAAPLVAWLALATAVRLPWTLVPKGLNGIGRPGLAALTAAAAVASRALVLVAWATGELQNFAMLLAAADVLSLAALAWLARQHLGYGLRQAAAAVAPSAVLAGASVGTAAAVWFGISGAAGAASSSAHWLALPIAGLAAAAAWWVVAHALKHPVTEELRKLQKAAQTLSA